MSGFIIGSGYNRKSEWDEDFARIWYKNLRAHAPFPQRIAIISTGAEFPVEADEIDVYRGGQRGHVGEYCDGKRFGQLCGWSASVMALALLAYNSNADLVFLEQDAMAFRKWVERAYEDMGENEMIFGAKMLTKPFMPCSQSLFIIRHYALLRFVSAYLALPEDAILLPESKFCEIEQSGALKCARFSFGVDRERPIPWDAPVFFAQQWTQAELDEAKRRGLV